MEGVALAVVEPRWATSTLRIASLMISAHTLTVPVEDQGKCFQTGEEISSDSYSDPNCGAAFNAAVDDTALGLANGCSQSNPNNRVAKPNSAPVCR